MGDPEADIFAHCMPSGAAETGAEQALKRARPDLRKTPGRQGGRSNYPPPSQLPWRPTPASFSAQPAQDSQLGLISKLLLKHEEQLAALRKDTQFVLFFRQDDKSILPSLMSVSREWKAKQAAGDQSIQSSQRTVLINCLLRELLARMQRVVATEPGRESLKKAEWLTSSNAWTYMRWSSKLRKLVADETKEPLVHDEAVRIITELQKSMRGEVIHKFQSTINLAKLEEQGAQQAIFHLAVSLRGSEATEVYDQFRQLAGLSLTNLAGFSMKVDDQLRPPMAQQLAQMTYGGGRRKPIFTNQYIPTAVLQTLCRPPAPLPSTPTPLHLIHSLTPTYLPTTLPALSSLSLIPIITATLTPLFTALACLSSESIDNSCRQPSIVTTTGY